MPVSIKRPIYLTQNQPFNFFYINSLNSDNPTPLHERITFNSVQSLGTTKMRGQKLEIKPNDIEIPIISDLVDEKKVCCACSKKLSSMDLINQSFKNSDQEDVHICSKCEESWHSDQFTDENETVLTEKKEYFYLRNKDLETETSFILSQNDELTIISDNDSEFIQGKLFFIYIYNQ